MKKFCIVMALCSALTFTEVFADRSFSDLPDSHWAYGVVQQLVDAGRINGYPDGSFQPDNQVTRWEFAKMAGGNPDEVSEPDRASTRDEAAAYLWELAGKPSADAPSVVTKGSDTPQAVAWCYTYGIMQGDDGINLRLGSTLSRAEAAALIVRAEQEGLQPVDFIDSIKPSVVLERIWNGARTGMEYNENTVITNGQLARIALSLGSELTDINYSALKQQPGFSGEYAKDIMLVCQECLGADRASASFMNSPANMQDAVAVLSFYTMRKSAGSLNIGEGNYSDATLDTTMGKMALKFAHYNGIRLYSMDKLNADKQLTMKDAACILLQLDEVVGLNKSGGNVHATPMLKQEYPYPANASDYAYILKEVPWNIYETPINGADRPVDSYEYAVNFTSMLTNFLKDTAKLVPESVKVEWTFYPSMVVKTDNEVIMRAGLRILKNDNNLSLNEIFGRNTLDKTYDGDVFFIDITTGTPILDIVVDTSDYNIIRAFN